MLRRIKPHAFVWWLALAVLSAHAAHAQETESPAEVPIAGAGEARAEFDETILAHLELSRATAATFALMIDGRVVYARGYGWLDLDKTRPTPPDTPMRVASISKPITSAAIHKLIAAGKLGEDTKVWPLLKIDPPEGATLDPRWHDVTVAHLLEHKGGWDIKQLGFDPMFSARRARQELKLDKPPTPEDMVRWMTTIGLSFDPGERSAYSNFGYCVLGRVIERVARRPYIVYIQREICRPVGIPPTGMWLGHTDLEKRDRREPEYNQPCNVDIMDAHGGIVVSSPVLCQFLARYWISGEPRRPNERGYVYTFFGSMPGTSAIAHQRADGINFACAFNGRHPDASQKELTQAINRQIDKLAR